MTFRSFAPIMLACAVAAPAHAAQPARTPIEAAVKLAELQGISHAAIQKGLDSFPGLAHRLEFVRELQGVEWINDSKATNVDSALVALRAHPGRVWLIAGGKWKGAPYAPLGEAARGKVKGVLTIGQDARLNHRFSVVAGVRAEECAARLRAFFAALRAAGEK